MRMDATSSRYRTNVFVPIAAHPWRDRIRREHKATFRMRARRRASVGAMRFHVVYCTAPTNNAMKYAAELAALCPATECASFYAIIFACRGALWQTVERGRCNRTHTWRRARRAR